MFKEAVNNSATNRNVTDTELLPPFILNVMNSYENQRS